MQPLKAVGTAPVRDVRQTFARDITEAKNVGQEIGRLDHKEDLALRDSHEQLNTVMKHVADGITIMSAQGKLLYVNDKAAEINGFSSPEEFLATPVAEITKRFEVLDDYGKSVSFDRLPTRRALQGLEAPEMVVRFRIIASGEVRWSRVRASPIFDEHGKVRSVITIFRDITEEHLRQERTQFLESVNVLLYSALNYEETLQKVADLVVPKFSDWCIVQLFDPPHTLRNVAVAHKDPDMIRWASEVGKEYPPEFRADRGAGKVIMTGRCELYREISDEMLKQSARSDRHLEILKHLGMKSVLIVPLKARDTVLGVIALISAESGRTYSDADLELTNDIAERMAIAIDNERLYKEVQEELLERNKAEDELRQSEERYRSLVSATSQVVWSTHADGTVIDDIPSWRAFTGQSKEEVQGTRWAEAIHPEDQEPTTHAWLQAVHNRSLFSHEYRLRSKSGEYRYMLSRAVPILDEQGNVREWIGTTTDIQEAKLAEEKVRKMHEELEHRVAMRTSELYIANRKLRAEIIERQRIEEQDRANLKRLSHIIDSMPMGAIITDEQLKVLHLNERFCQLFKMESPSSLIHKNGQEIMEMAKANLTQPDHYEQGLFEILQKQQPVLGSELHMKDGRIISCDYIPIFVQEMHRGHILLYRDITQERRTNAAKSEFMSLASHQLRTPLTAIRWSLGKLSKSMKHKATDLEYSILVEGHHEAVRMAETIDTMLAISQVESGKTRLRKTTVALKPCLQEVMDNFKEEYGARNQTVTLECPEDLYMPSDQKLLHEIFGNLFSNAVKYTPAEGSLSITARQLGDAVRIDVADTGYGIPAHQHDQIFHKYFRGENVLHKETDGNGLGLYLVSQLVKLLDGRISFESREGQGTTFSIHFPLITL